MSRPKLNRWWLAFLPALIGFGPDRPLDEGAPEVANLRWPPPTSLDDPRLATVAEATQSWAERRPPERSVIDVVCVVPDTASFLEAVALWDQTRWFPILFDEVESTARFLRAFRPARVVRWNRRKFANDASVWDQALLAVKVAGGDRAGATEGLVLTTSQSHQLPGAVALAAGRFQSLIRLEAASRFEKVLTPAEFRELDLALTQAVCRKVPNYDELGDDCDFVTLAGDWPYRYLGADGKTSAVDDRLCRSPVDNRRWAYVGRLVGDEVRSADQAMCSLFLQPNSALLFEGYDERASPWSAFAVRFAARSLATRLDVTLATGPGEGSLSGWHQAFGRANRFGLILANSRGTPAVFDLRGGSGTTLDIPRGVPAAVSMIHSFAAADPSDERTIAGRWLANGAFIFAGSMNEPYLFAFRPPLLVADLIARRLPLSVAFRATVEESFGTPWRLVFLGDPLYRLEGNLGPRPREPMDTPMPGCSMLDPAPRPPEDDSAGRVAWAVDATFARLSSRGSAIAAETISDVLMHIDRQSLDPTTRRRFDDLLVENLPEAGRSKRLRRLALGWDRETLSSSLRRWLEFEVAGSLERALTKADGAEALEAWSGLMKLDPPTFAVEQATPRLARLLDTPNLRGPGRDAILTEVRDRLAAPDQGALGRALRRLEVGIIAERARRSAPNVP